MPTETDQLFDTEDMLLNTVLVGFGIVGKATALALGIKKHISKDMVYHDFYGKGNLEAMYRDNKYYIICLPTPTNKNGEQDLVVLAEWMLTLSKRDDAVVIIRSTVLPGTVKFFQERHPNLKIAFVPEFLNQKTALNDTKNPELMVIGCDDIWLREEVKALFKVMWNKSQNKIECDTTTAELIKYTMNSFFALKVIFGNQLYDVAQRTGADYSLVKMALTKHKWGSHNGWDVFHNGFRGYGGACLPKDVSALATKFDVPLLKKVQEINKQLIKEAKHA